MASWNPAFMPNTTADIPAPLPTDEPVADTTKHANDLADDDGADFWGVDDGVGEEDAPTQNDGSDSWFPDYGNNTTAPATTDAQTTTQIPSATGPSDSTETAQTITNDVEAVEPAPTQPEAPEPTVEDTQATETVSEDATAADIVPEHTEPTDAATEKADTDEPSDIASKHTSTMSFTRTIPHEPSWSDDGDPEWNLARADTDPFKFLPSSDRTNSFPPVPPLEQHEQHREEQQEHDQEHQQQQEQHQTETYQERSPIAQPQVADFLRDDDEVEVPGDDGFFSQLSEAQSNGFEQTGAEDGNDSQQQYMGGDLGDKATEALDARFEEGVPLISHDGNTATQQENGKDLFGGEDGNDDDFFNRVQQQDASQTEHEPQPLERKSTMQVLGAMDMGSVQPSVETVEEQPEEEADAATETHDQDQPEATTADEHTGESSEEPKPEETKPEGEDLDAKWKELFADDEEDTLSLLDDSTEASNDNKEKEIDPAAFFGSDDEGFLSDSEEFPTMNTTQRSAPSVAGSNTTTTPTTRYMPQGQTPSLTGAANPYAPAPPPLTSAPSNPYFPAAPTTVAQTPVTPFGAAVSAPPPAGRFSYGAVPPPQIERKAESFVDKKGGYQSPYDLPMEVVKVKKRPSMATLNKPVTAPAVPPPPKSATHLPPPPATSVPPSSQPGVKPPPPSGGARPKEKFFEELPVVTKARPASRHTMGTASPAQVSPYGPPPTAGSHVASRPPVPGMPPAMGSAPNSPPTQHAEIPNLVAPPRLNPYASLPSNTSNLAPAVPAPATSRYSPAPPSGSQLSTPVPPAAASRYSPAPPASRPTSSGYTPTTSAPPVLPPVLPHQPRTSSPLAHFESRPLVAGHGESGLSEKRSSNSLYDLRLQRVPSLPPTQEVEEEGPMQGMVSPNQVPAVPHQTSPTASRHGALPHRSRRTPPPQSLTVQPVTSPQRVTSSYQPAATAPSHEFAPPPRSQTQSPGALYGNRNAKPIDPIPRPSSVTDTTSPRAALYSPITMQPSSTFPAVAAPTSRPRGNTQNFNLVSPTDGREHDPLQRWRGVPLISWGVGGTLVTMFPKDVPRYGMGSTAPMVIRSPGEVKIKSMKDIEPMEERLAKFPGPLKGKSKKKETITWLTNGIETLEKTVPTNLSHQLSPSHEDKRTTERLLLWKILRVFVEHDGVLEGNPTVNQAVREILYPEASAIGGQPEFASALNPSGLGNSATTSLQADSVDSSAVEQIRNHLITGDSEKAVWAAVDKRLWGHAFLLANALNPDLYKRVAQEFVKNEVNSTGHNNESLAALYDVLSGNHEESVDELVPAHARAGLQLVAKDSTSGVSKDAMGGLDKWRETLSLILSNRTPDDARAINSMGNLLSGYGRAEAAHICFLFARSQTIFGGLDNPASNFVLVGSDHRRQAEQFAKEIEPLLLSEVYEYGQTLAGGTVPVSNPHLAAYKLQHAYALAEYGFRDKALQYCEAIMAAITAQTKRSPYYHPILEAYVDDLMKRLKQAPKEESNSWIPKPSMNKVSDSMWNRFNKFVAGDDNEDGAKGSPDAAGESGPFARIAGGTPTISRSPSANNLETFGAAIPSYGMPTVPTANGPNMFSPPPTRTASRYAPGAPQPSTPNYNPYETNSPYAPRSSMERASGEYSRSSLEMPRQSMDSQRGYSHSNYAPNRTSSPAQPYTPYGATPQEPSYIAPNTQPQPSVTSPPTTTSGYQPFTPQNNVQTNAEPANEAPSAPSTGYQPPSYGGYEPPSSTPYEAPATNNGEDESKENGDSNQASETGNTFEPPSYQPYSYEPPSYEPDTQPSKDEHESEEDKPKPKKKGPMYDDDDEDFPAVSKPAGKSKAEIDRENEEMVRRIAEEEAKRAAEAKAAKRGWGFTSWFAKKEAAASDASAASSPGKPIRAKLGEANSFYFDPEQKRWVNKNASPEDQAAKKATPPPPKGGTPRSSASSPAPPMGGSVPNTPGGGRASAPPTGPPRPSALMPSASENNISSGPPSAVGVEPPTPGGPPSSAGLLSPGMATAMQRTASSTSAPPPGGASKPLSSTSSIDDLLGAAGPRKRGEAKKPRKAARYVDVMQK